MMTIKGSGFKVVALDPNLTMNSVSPSGCLPKYVNCSSNLTYSHADVAETIVLKRVTHVCEYMYAYISDKGRA